MPEDTPELAVAVSGHNPREMENKTPDPLKESGVLLFNLIFREGVNSQCPGL